LVHEYLLVPVYGAVIQVETPEVIVKYPYLNGKGWVKSD
jgi:hypothetical protein